MNVYHIYTGMGFQLLCILGANDTNVLAGYVRPYPSPLHAAIHCMPT
jgi:hypothetical protein